MTVRRIRSSYQAGAQKALEKLGTGGFGDFMSSMGSSIKNTLTGANNPMRQKVNAGSGQGSTGNMKTNVGKLISGGSPTTATTPAGG